MRESTTTTENHTNPPLRIIFFGMTGAFSRAPLLALLRAGDASPAPDAPRIEVCVVVLPTLAGVATLRLLRADASDPHPAFIRIDRQAGVGKPRRAPLATLPIALTAPVTHMPSSASAESATSGDVATLASTDAPSQNILEMAAAHGIPSFEVARLNDPRTLAALAEFAPDAICVACFSRRLPTALLHLPRLGCLNVHPSLLPDNRGPDPLFWTFHAGEATTGVTIHLMDEGMDTGPVVLQEAITIPEGISEAALEARQAAVGGELLAQAVAGLATGALLPKPQDNAYASAHPWPTADDYVIPAAEWSAERAYRFARGVAARGQPITLVAADGARFQLVAALGYSDDAHVASLDAKQALSVGEPWRLSGDTLWLRCASGVLRAHVANESAPGALNR